MRRFQDELDQLKKTRESEKEDFHYQLGKSNQMFDNK